MSSNKDNKDSKSTSTTSTATIQSKPTAKDSSNKEEDYSNESPGQRTRRLQDEAEERGEVHKAVTVTDEDMAERERQEKEELRRIKQEEEADKKKRAAAAEK